MVRISALIGLFLTLLSCQESLVLKKTDYLGKNLNIDGYYYGNQNGVNNILFFYKNGIIRYVGSLKTNEVREMDNYIIKEFINSKPSDKSRVSWGVFKIHALNIEYDMWYPRENAPVYRRKGLIINDSSFIIKSVSKPNSKEFKEDSITYHFHQFNPKPDSTNSFIK